MDVLSPINLYGGASISLWEHFFVLIQVVDILDSKPADGPAQTEETALLNSCGQQTQAATAKPKMSGKLRQICACPPHGIVARTITYGRWIEGEKQEWKKPPFRFVRSKSILIYLDFSPAQSAKIPGT